MEPIGLTKTNPKIKLWLFELIPKISAQYLLWGPSKWIFSVGLGSKWLTSVVIAVVVLVVAVGFCYTKAHPSSLAFLAWGWAISSPLLVTFIIYRLIRQHLKLISEIMHLLKQHTWLLKRYCTQRGLGLSLDLGFALFGKR